MSGHSNSYKHGYLGNSYKQPGYQGKYYKDQCERRLALYHKYKHPVKVSKNWYKILIIAVVTYHNEIKMLFF